MRSVVIAFDVDGNAAMRFAADVRALHAVDVTAATDLAAATLAADIVVTGTPSRAAFLGPRHVRPGTFIGAVGADNEHKSELEPALLAAAAVVVDDLEQCATIGDLHHAIAADAMPRDRVRADLAAVVVDPRRGRHTDDEVVVFDSTGVALEDVAVAAVAFERAVERAVGAEVCLGG